MSVVVGLAAFLLLAGAGCSTGGGSTSGTSATVAPPTAGAFVLTPDDSGNQWYEGNVDQISGSIYTVKLRSNDKMVARPLTSLAPYPSGFASVKVGDKVVAAWTSDTFYRGVVTAVSDSSATIKWDDGAEPSDVSLTAVVKTYK